jgi:PAS domain S-box-containing protein
MPCDNQKKNTGCRLRIRCKDWQKAIFEESRDAIIISDTEARFVDANEEACKLTGYSKESAKGQA